MVMPAYPLQAHRDLTSDLAKIKHAETRKIQQARRLLREKMRECDDKSRQLDSRIKASSHSLLVVKTAFQLLKLLSKLQTTKTEP